MPAAPLPLEEALTALLAAGQPVQERQQLALESCPCRVVAADLKATLDLPSFRASSMDGYAVAGPHRQGYQLVGESLAGHPWDGDLAAGQAVRVTTGALVPAGAEALILDEEAQIEKGCLRSERMPTKGRWIRPQGSDLTSGSLLLERGRRLSPFDLALAAAQGWAELPVWRRVRVGFFSTGDELQPPIAGGGCVHDVNRPLLRSLLAGFEIAVEAFDLGAVADSAAALEAAMGKARDQRLDLLITSGGASAGRADLMATTLARLGQIDFHRVAVRPGKPLLLGRIGSLLCLCLPGNPVSVAVAFTQFVRPLLWRLAGAGDCQPLRFKVKTADHISKEPGRLEFQRGRLEAGEDGELRVRSLQKQESYVLSSLAAADCLLLLPAAATEIAAGSLITVEPLMRPR